MSSTMLSSNASNAKKRSSPNNAPAASNKKPDNAADASARQAADASARQNQNQNNDDDPTANVNPFALSSNEENVCPNSGSVVARNRGIVSNGVNERRVIVSSHQFEYLVDDGAKKRLAYLARTPKSGGISSSSPVYLDMKQFESAHQFIHYTKIEGQKAPYSKAYSFSFKGKTLLIISTSGNDGIERFEEVGISLTRGKIYMALRTRLGLHCPGNSQEGQPFYLLKLSLIDRPTWHSELGWQGGEQLFNEWREDLAVFLEGDWDWKNVRLSSDTTKADYLKLSGDHCWLPLKDPNSVLSQRHFESFNVMAEAAASHEGDDIIEAFAQAIAENNTVMSECAQLVGGIKELRALDSFETTTAQISKKHRASVRSQLKKQGKKAGDVYLYVHKTEHVEVVKGELKTINIVFRKLLRLFDGKTNDEVRAIIIDFYAKVKRKKLIKALRENTPMSEDMVQGVVTFL